MKLEHPVQSVIPSAYGAVLGVLARTSEPLTGRRVALLTRPRFSQSRVNRVLVELARDGIVDADDRPPSRYYRLNREHVAAPGILALATMWQTLLDRIQTALTQWPEQPVASWLFGSAARGEADAISDVDILMVRQDHPSVDETWHQQLGDLAGQVRRWSGNACEILVLTESEIRAAIHRGDRLIEELRRDAIHLAGTQPHALLGRSAS
jgi:predicted nucleotidyltransferase